MFLFRLCFGVWFEEKDLMMANGTASGSGMNSFFFTKSSGRTNLVGRLGSCCDYSHVCSRCDSVSHSDSNNQKKKSLILH